MKVYPLSSLPVEPSDPQNFTGPGSLRRIQGAIEDPSVNVYRVHFEAGSRTNWHEHTGHQLLLVVEGTCRVQKLGDPVEEAGPGDTIVVLPGERHWHGAGPDGAMTHLALNVDAATRWFGPVSDNDYAG